MTARQPIIFRLYPNQTVGAGLPAMAASQPMSISLMHPEQTVGVSLLAMAV